ncbi:MAG: PadR family transcriptional regulator [Ktedonobacterales bacterium]
MYELIVLALLAQWPLHGYLIAKITNDMLGPYARLSSGRLYPLLTRLEAWGLIAIAGAQQPTSGRRQRTYRITEEGRWRCHELLMDTTSNLGDYQRVFWYKVASMSLLDLSERLYLVDHYIIYCQTNIYHHQAEIADMPNHRARFEASPPLHYEATLLVLEHVLRQWRLQLEDATSLRARLAVDGVASAGAAADERATADVERGARNGDRRHKRSRTIENANEERM